MLPVIDTSSSPTPGAPEQPWWREPTRGQWFSFLAAWFGWVMDSFDFTIFLLVMPQITADFGVSKTAAAGSITLTLLVRLLGGLCAGAAADRWGRKLPLLISVVWFAACDGAVAFAPTFGWVLALRTLFGFGMGAEWTSGATLAMENWPPRSRGIASGILQGSWAIGYLLAAAISAWVLPRWGWRGLFVLAALPALMVLPIRAWVPESADWKEKAQARSAEPTATEPFNADMVKKLTWASLMVGLGFGGYYGLATLYPTLLRTELGKVPGDVARLVAIFNVGMLFGAIGCGTLAARRGVVPAVALPAFCAGVILPLYVGTVPSLLAVGALVAGVFGGGIAGVTPVMLTALFPAQVRARASGLVYHAGAFMAAFVPPGVAWLAEHHGLSLGRALMMVTGTCYVLLVSTMFMRPRVVTAALVKD